MSMLSNLVSALIIDHEVPFSLSRYEYHWCDGDRYKRPTALPANKYISLLMDWAEAQINNEEIFPCRVGKLVKMRRIVISVFEDKSSMATRSMNKDIV